MNQSQFNQQADVVIVGSGIAGLSLASYLAERNQQLKIAVLSKRTFDAGSTYRAQGGMAAVLDPKDSFEKHVQDTLVAGVKLGDRSVVEAMVKGGPMAVKHLLKNQIHLTPFTEPDARFPYHLTKEGGHSRRRVIHHADHTGKSIQMGLYTASAAHPNIQLFEYHHGVKIITDEQSQVCRGIYVYDETHDRMITFAAPVVVLATGGANRAYLYTTNPDAITGDGIAMAWRAGCRICNMEFIQFHPTCLYHPQDRSFLISEAVRGEGGILRTPDGQAFMHKYDERAELAPRDIVARAIDAEMKIGGFDFVHLDVTHLEDDFIVSHFPTIFQRCLDVGIDIRHTPIPVVPAAHYTCGGVKATLEGTTDVPGLYAIGEVAYTGVHGANRLASNSLLEAMVMAEKAYPAIAQYLAKTPAYHSQPADWDSSHVHIAKEKVIIHHNWDELRRVMWDYVGIVRNNARLEMAQRRINLIKEEVEHYYFHHRISSDFIELRNLVTVADLIVQSAMLRQESRGLHYNTDYPDKLDPPTITTIAGRTPK